MKKIVAVNCSPRKGWNTSLLVEKAAEGARSAGAEVRVFDLYRLEKFTGCISCFACKLPASYGRCACRDGLKPVLDAIREADGLIVGTPNYLNDVSSGFRALYERLIFQSLTYRTEQRCCNERFIPVLFVMTSNCPEEMYEANGYDKLLAGYKARFDGFVGPTKILTAGNTLQVNDYSPYGWSYFDPEAKKKSREEAFPPKLEQAFALGAGMVEEPWKE